MIYIFRAGIAIAEAEQKILTADEEGYMYGVKFEKFSKGIQTINSTVKFIGII